MRLLGCGILGYKENCSTYNRTTHFELIYCRTNIFLQCMFSHLYKVEIQNLSCFVILKLEYSVRKKFTLGKYDFDYGKYF